MEYQVPQFIEVESKIVGPLTLRQFLFLGGGIGASVAAFLFLPLIFALLITGLFGGLGVALAFYKVNGKPFIEVLEAGFAYLTHTKLFLWQKVEHKKEKEVRPIITPARTARLTQGKLSELAWSLDVKKNVRGGGEQESK